MYDRDIQLLQFCAATLPSDEFLVHLLNKFGLTAWAAKVGVQCPLSTSVKIFGNMNQTGGGKR
jgi:hypothetical protein